MEKERVMPGESEKSQGGGHRLPRIAGLNGRETAGKGKVLLLYAL